MKLKMAPNSLFAVLLRSSWWISLAIAMVFVALTQALLPAEYRVVGGLGSLPFFVIAGIALVRQLRAPGARESQAILDAVARMNWAEFGAALGSGFEKHGYAVERLPAGAADLLLRREGRTTLVSARRWKAARPGEEALAALQAAARRQDASACIYVSLGELSANARSFAQRESVELVQGPELVRLLRGVPLPSG